MTGRHEYSQTQTKKDYNYQIKQRDCDNVFQIPFVTIEKKPSESQHDNKKSRRQNQK